MSKVTFYNTIKDKPNKEEDLKENLIKLFDDILAKAKIDNPELNRKLAGIRAKINIEL